MKNKRLIIICIAAGIVAAVIVAVMLHTMYGSRVARSGRETNNSAYYDDGAPPADPSIVGKWQNADNPQWYKVYYDDYDGDGYYWGKEWSEDDDVYEEDLQFHGNGWFRWRKENKILVEHYMMEIRDVPITRRWRLRTKPDSLLLFYPDDRRQCDRFGRVPTE